MQVNRVIGTFEGSEKGSLLLVFAAMHGNEPAGIHALEFLFKMLEVEPITNPKFDFRGKIIGLRGHTRAIAQGKRFIQRDLNRQWSDENVEKILDSPIELLDEEGLEIKEILELIKNEIEIYQPKKITILDIHTTSAQGGIFSIPAENQESINLAKKLHAPVVLGLLNGIKGTTLQYFNSKNLQIPTTSLCFEAGQHDEPLSINRAIAAILFTLNGVDCIDEKNINPQHTKVLEDYAKELPSVATFFYRHAVKKDDFFQMEKGFQNFQFVKKDTLIATDKNGKIFAPKDCRILMPLYQQQGEDGFFLVE
jgi:succinylglutamate desuccinylase